MGIGEEGKGRCGHAYMQSTGLYEVASTVRYLRHKWWMAAYGERIGSLGLVGSQGLGKGKRQKANGKAGWRVFCKRMEQ